jgi:hypothetical protein
MKIQTIIPLFLASFAASYTYADTTVFIDFGINTNLSDSESWNNVSRGSGNSSSFDDTIVDLIDITGLGTGYSLESSFTSIGVNLDGIDTDTVSPFYAASATDDSFYMSSSNTGLLTISGLDAGFTYSFDLYASRSGTGERLTDYTIVGGNKTEIVSLDVLGNDADIATVTGFTADELGIITIYIEAGTDASYAYLGAISMTTATIPEPSSYALLAGVSGLAFVVLRRRRV